MEIIKNLNLEIGNWYSCNELKNLLQHTYYKIGLKKTATATDILLIYKSSLEYKKVDGVTTKGFKIENLW